eukprot:364639-Chlamydomonas_euryale.AAC.48
MQCSMAAEELSGVQLGLAADDSYDAGHGTPESLLRTSTKLAVGTDPTTARQMGYLAEACERFALEAHRLGGVAGEELAKSFDDLRRRL